MKGKSSIKARAPTASAAGRARKSQPRAARRAAAAKEPVSTAGPRYEKSGHPVDADPSHSHKQRKPSPAGELQRYTELYDGAPVGYATLDKSGTVRQINRAGASLLGFPIEGITGRSFSTFLVGREDRRLFSKHLQRSHAFGEKEEIVTTELHLARGGNGDRREVQLTSRREVSIHELLPVVITDISSLRRAQAKLGADNELLEGRVNERTAQLATASQELQREFRQRQRMEKEMTEISEQERRSLGQELHDGICQHLTGVAMMADTLSDACKQRSLPEVSVKVKALADLIRTAANDTRNVARGLHPVEMDANGLVSALYDLAARQGTAGKVRCRLQCNDAVPIQDNGVAMHLYRIAQQALANASEHEHARNVTINLGMQKNDIILSIADDGDGVSSDDELSEAPGLSMMRHRASVIGARLKFQTSGAGRNVVSCTLPAFALSASTTARR